VPLKLSRRPTVDSDPATAPRYQFWPDDVPRGAPHVLLETVLDHAKVIVAFNGGFDLKVMAHGRADALARWRAKLFDPFAAIRSAGFGSFKLDMLLKANGLQTKPGSGLDAACAGGMQWKSALSTCLRGTMSRTWRCWLGSAPSCEPFSCPRGRPLGWARLGYWVEVETALRPPECPPRNRSSSAPQNGLPCDGIVSPPPSWAPSAASLRSSIERKPTKPSAARTSSSLESRPRRCGGESNASEEEAIRRYEAATGNFIDKVGFAIPTDERYAGWTGASPDGLGREDDQLCLEVKVPGNGRPVAKPSPSYFLQCQWHLFCSGRQYCDFVSLGSQEMTIARIRRDEDLLAFILPHLRAFWEHAQTNDEFALEFDMRDRASPPLAVDGL
jgi:hypothetical protein